MTRATRFTLVLLTAVAGGACHAQSDLLKRRDGGAGSGGNASAPTGSGGAGTGGSAGTAGAAASAGAGGAGGAPDGSSNGGAPADGGAGSTAVPTGGGGGGAGGSGGSDAGCPPPATCANDLSGALAYTIAFDLKVTNPGSGGILLSQRPPVACDNPMAAHWWELDLFGDGRMGFSYFLGSYVEATETAINAPVNVNDGATHKIGICRSVPDGLRMFIDDKQVKMGGMLSAFASLPPLVVGASGCFPSPITGVTLANVCLGSR